MTQPDGVARQLLPRDERRAQLLRAAASAFAAGGFAVTSMEDVASEAGVTKLILYRHFESKEDLYRAVLDEVSARMREEFLRAVNRPDPEGAHVRSLLTVARENPDGYRLLVFHAPREPQFEEQVFDYWLDAVDQVDRSIGDDVADPSMRRWVVRAVMSYLLHAVLLWLEEGDPQLDERFVETATDGLRALDATWRATPGR